MKKIVYVEGPDCAGKTTLINAIQREGDKVIHNGRFPTAKDAYDAYIKQLQDFKTDEFDRLILDRGVLSEIVYGQVMRNTVGDVVLLKTIMDLIQEFDYDIIICLPHFGQTVIKWAQRLESEYTQQFEQYVTIYEMFQRLPKEVADVMVHDYTQNNQEIIDHVNRK